jgi:predicted outer membrane repeat protein
VLKIWASFTTLMVWAVVLSLVMAAVLYGLPEQVNAADFHVTTAAEFQAALDAAENNGQDDIIYLAAGTYWSNFEYLPQDGMSLTIRGEPGTTAQDVNLNPMGADVTVLDLGGSGANGSVAVEGLTIVNGRRSGLDIYCAEGNLDVIVRKVVIYGAEALHMGGGIEISAGIDATSQGNGVINVEVYDCVIAYNEAFKRGGGIYANSCYGNSSIDLLIVNSLIYGNGAKWSGGGIELSASELGDNNETRAVIINSTITDNAADTDSAGQESGGGIRAFAYAGNGAIVSLDLYNTIVYGNTSLGGLPGQDLYFGEWGLQDCTVNAYHSDIGDWAIKRGTPTYNPVNVINADPVFVNPGEEEYQLNAGSPCIDAGTTAVPDPPGLPATDFEGNPRVSGVAPDMGAYEFTEGGVPPPMVIDFSPEDFSFFATEGGANPASQTLEVWNSGSFTLDWSVADGAAWLGLNPPSGSSTGPSDVTEVTVSVDISGMSAGSYDATITISAPLAVNHPQTVPVNLTINPAGAGIAWNFPSTSDVFLAPTPANSRPYLDAAVSLPTGTEPTELLGVYWLDEATGGVAILYPCLWRWYLDFPGAR